MNENKQKVNKTHKKEKTCIEHIQEAHHNYQGNIFLAEKEGQYSSATYAKWWKKIGLSVDYSRPEGLQKQKIVPSELEEQVCLWHKEFEENEFEVVKNHPEYTPNAIVTCWKKYELGSYAKSPFSQIKNNSVIYGNSCRRIGSRRSAD
jgi:hypothetical protein